MSIDRLQSIGELVNIQHFDAMELGDLIEIEVVGDHFAGEQLGQLNQLHVHFADVRKILLHDLYIQIWEFLDALKDIESAAPTIALHRVGRVGDQLKFTAMSAMRPSMITLVSRILKL